VTLIAGTLSKSVQDIHTFFSFSNNKITDLASHLRFGLQSADYLRHLVIHSMNIPFRLCLVIDINILYVYGYSSWVILLAAGRRVFREFLRTEFSDENLLYWLACEELKKEEDPKNIEEKARLIYEDYISIISPREVLVSSLFMSLSCFVTYYY